MTHEIAIFAETVLQNEAELYELIDACAKCTLDTVGVDFAAHVDVTIVDADAIQDINREHREKDSVTDVLSFPMFQFHNGQALEPLAPDPETGRVMLGDMVLCLDRAREQAEEFHHSVARECGYLTIHSVLHLLGYDHEQGDADKAEMRRLEQVCLESMQLFREDGRA